MCSRSSSDTPAALASDRNVGVSMTVCMSAYRTALAVLVNPVLTATSPARTASGPNVAPGRPSRGSGLPWRRLAGLLVGRLGTLSGPEIIRRLGRGHTRLVVMSPALVGNTHRAVDVASIEGSLHQ